MPQRMAEAEERAGYWCPGSGDEHICVGVNLDRVVKGATLYPWGRYIVVLFKGQLCKVLYKRNI